MKRSLTDQTQDLFRTFRKGSSFFEKPVRNMEGFRIRTFQIASAGVPAGKKLLFFSDLHMKGGIFLNLFGGKRAVWKDDPETLIPPFRKICDTVKPDVLLFGGDLISFSCMLPHAEKFLSSFGTVPHRIAVYGNWDKRRRKWLPFKVLEDLYARAGWKLLCNEGCSAGPFRFYGCDDAKIGQPEIGPFPQGEAYAVLLSHNPDGIMELPGEKLSHFDLALCGHTHAGQIRIPFFGAVRTSSRYWKRFEYGAYRSESLDLDMFVSAGIGTTLLRLRIFDPPEVLVFEFI